VIPQAERESLQSELEGVQEELALREVTFSATQGTLENMKHLQWDLRSKCREVDDLVGNAKANHLAHSKAIQALETALKVAPPTPPHPLQIS